MEKLELLCIACGKLKWQNHSGKLFKVCKNIKVHILCDQEISLTHICQREISVYVHKIFHRKIHSSFIHYIKKWKQTKCLWTG